MRTTGIARWRERYGDFEYAHLACRQALALRRDDERSRRLLIFLVPRPALAAAAADHQQVGQMPAVPRSASLVLRAPELGAGASSGGSRHRDRWRRSAMRPRLNRRATTSYSACRYLVRDGMDKIAKLGRVAAGGAIRGGTRPARAPP